MTNRGSLCYLSTLPTGNCSEQRHFTLLISSCLMVDMRLKLPSLPRLVAAALAMQNGPRKAQTLPHFRESLKANECVCGRACARPTRDELVRGVQVDPDGIIGGYFIFQNKSKNTTKVSLMWMLRVKRKLYLSRKLRILIVCLLCQTISHFFVLACVK